MCFRKLLFSLKIWFKNLIALFTDEFHTKMGWRNVALKTRVISKAFITLFTDEYQTMVECTDVLHFGYWQNRSYSFHIINKGVQSILPKSLKVKWSRYSIHNKMPNSRWNTRSITSHKPTVQRCTYQTHLFIFTSYFTYYFTYYITSYFLFYILY